MGSISSLTHHANSNLHLNRCEKGIGILMYTVYLYKHNHLRKISIEFARNTTLAEHVLYEQVAFFELGFWSLWDTSCDVATEQQN